MNKIALVTGVTSGIGEEVVLVFAEQGWRDGDWFAVATGSLDHSEEFLPDEHYGIESQVSWLNIDDEFPRISTQEHMGYTVEG